MRTLRYEDIEAYFPTPTLEKKPFTLPLTEPANPPAIPLHPRVVMVNTFDISGGAARAAYRLHQGMNHRGMECQMVVQDKKSDDPRVVGPATPWEKIDSFFRGYLDQIPLIFYPQRTATPFSPSVVPFSPAVKKINALNPQVIHLHWVQKSMLTIADLKRLQAPLVWTMHDMWPFTGGEHYDEDQHHFEDHCGASKVLGSPRNHDLSRTIWNKKHHHWAKLPLTLVSPSRWLADQARHSSLFHQRRIEVIPNGIDTQAFAPQDQALARRLLRIPEKGRMLLFPAMDPTSDPRKGFDLLKEALVLLKRKGEQVHLLVMGASGMKDPGSLGFPVTFLGRLHDDVTLNLAYNAADAVVVPSRQENFANTLLEAMAVGRPCTAFQIGGNPDFIDHRQTGYLARALDTEDLAQGISWVLDKKNGERAGDLARRKVLAQFEIGKVVRRYEALYREVLDKTNSPQL